VQAVVAEIEAAGGGALSVVCSIRDAGQLQAAVGQAASACKRIGILVNAFDPSAPFSSIIGSAH